MVYLYLLAFVPISLILEYLVHAPPVWVFLSATVAIIPLAVWIQCGTEQIASQTGPAIGSLLNVTFGNAAELIIALFLLADSKFDVVKGQITGSLIGNSLLGLGLAILIGTWGRQNLKFNRDHAGLLSTLLMLSLIGLLLPAIFDFTERYVENVPNPNALDEHLSLAVSAVLIVLYLANLVYTLVTHDDVFSIPQEGVREADGGTRGQSGGRALLKPVLILVAATAVTAWEAEIISGALEATAGAIGVSNFFLGVVVLALIGNIAEYTTSSYFAHQGNMDVAMAITVGGTVQIALFAAPLLVIISYLNHNPMDLVFSNPLELIAIFSVAIAVNAISKDGEVTWFEGAMLIGIYLLMMFAFLFVTVP